VGPTAVNALMSYNYAGPSAIRSLTLTFFAGLIEIGAGVLNLGGLIGFISAPVISAFTSAVSIQVMTSQVKGLLGLKVAGRGFLNTWIGVFSNINYIRPCDAVLGFSCIGILLFLRKLKDLRWLEGTDPESKRARILRKTKWAISIVRNSMVILVSAVIAYLIKEVWGKKDALILTGDVEEGLPSWQFPWQFNVNTSSANSSSPNPRENPLEMAEDFGIGLFMVSLVSILQHLAIAKFYTAPSQKNGCKPRNCSFRNVQLHWFFHWIYAYYCLFWSLGYQLSIRGSNSVWRLCHWFDCACSLCLFDTTLCIHSNFSLVSYDNFCYDFYN